MTLRHLAVLLGSLASATSAYVNSGGSQTLNFRRARATRGLAHVVCSFSFPEDDESDDGKMPAEEARARMPHAARPRSPQFPVAHNSRSLLRRA